MNRILTAAAVALFLAQATPALSHADHGPIDEYQAQVLATDYTTRLVSIDVGLGFGRLAESWLNLSTSVTTVHRKTDQYYVIGVFNEAENRTIYLLMSLGGDVYGINFTGKFKEIE